MRYFLDTVETIEAGVGFSHFNALHLTWLAVFAAVTAGLCALYRGLGARGRRAMRYAMAAALLLNEAFKTVCLCVGGRWIPDYLPLHLCSLNIFLIALHACRPSRLLDNYLYAVGVPTAAIALLFPSWTELPPANFMHLHSFTVHIQLAAYPIVLAVGGDIRPSARYFLKCLGFALALAVPAWIVNRLLGTNFMFLMRVEPGNPLKWFEQALGCHLWGIPVLGAVMLSLMYLLALPLRRIPQPERPSVRS